MLYYEQLNLELSKQEDVAEDNCVKSIYRAVRMRDLDYWSGREKETLRHLK